MLEYRKDIMPVFSFIEESIVPSNSQEEIDNQQLYEVFVRWCEYNGVNDKMSKRLFLKTLREGLKQYSISFKETHSGNDRFFRNIRFTNTCRDRLSHHLLFNLDRIEEELDEIEDDETQNAEEDIEPYVVPPEKELVTTKTEDKGNKDEGR